MSNVGKATGQAVANPLNHEYKKSGVRPCVKKTTEPEMTVTIMTDNMPLKSK